MNAPTHSTPLDVVVSRPEHVFPTLSPRQVERVAAHGRRRTTTPGEVLVEVGDRSVPFFVVVTGEVTVVRPDDLSDLVIVRHRAGQFSGESNMFSGRRSLTRLQVSEPGEVIHVDGGRHIM